MADLHKLVWRPGSLIWYKNHNLWYSALLISGNKDSSVYNVFVFGIHDTCYVEMDQIQDFVTHLDSHISRLDTKDAVWKEGVVEALVELFLDKRHFDIEDLDDLHLPDFPTRQNRIPKWVDRLVSSGRTNGEDSGSRIKSLKRIRDDLDEKDFKKGSLVWGKYGKTWWSAIVLNTVLSDSSKPKYKIMWLNDYTTSMLKVDDLLDFADHFQYIIKKFIKRMSLNWKRGTVGALDELYNHEKSFKPEELEKLAADGLQNIPNRIDSIPQSVQNALDKSRTSNFDVYKNKCPDRYKRIISSLLLSGKTLQGVQLCLGCYTDIEISHSHPIFQGALCKKCYDTLKSTLNTIGDDGFHFFCVICGNGGHTILCESGFCGKVYCIKCVQDFCKEGTWTSFVNQEKWVCFLCSGQRKLGVLLIKPDYNLAIDKMLYSEVKQIPLVKTPSGPLSQGTKLRVLSLFDGISTGLFALNKLKIPIDKYYASEVDSNCISVSKFHFMDKVTHIGDVTRITEEDIKQISPIHLVIGGSPCTDLSLVNPARKGLFDPNGTGHLFFEFYRILRLVSKQNKNGFYWLYENVAFMEISCKDVITRHLQSEPILKDAVYVSAQHRPRLFWGNLPLLLQSMPVVESNLQDVLWPYRTATVEKLATVTTKSNSLRQDCLYPVINEHNNPDVVCITELEKVFGFTPHYTDVCNMSAGQRQKLLGSAWSVPVIEHLFTPLQQICKT
ncbi:hypothetical protein RI129_011888 [Pyrocoelia pectoralis]|uniref:DNA (cytosine-5-)-methyltransferase n=1 Tax=Pyrocoelia pectoralis TaxID=417401 RepID=A0AAN7ZG94_9COLE